MFRIELAADATPAGGAVCGTALFKAEKDVKPKHIRLELLWATRGRGDADEGVIARADRETGPVAAGETVRVPFEAIVPRDAPRSFAGELIELYWCVRGRVDLPWAFDEKAETEFAVVSGRDSDAIPE